MTTHTLENNQLHCPVNLDKVLASIDELPSIPETLIEILKVIDDPASGPSDLAEVVRLDAPLMAKILRLANSPYYSPRAEINDINRCVAVLGYRTVRQVAICISVASTVMSAMSRNQGRLDYRELWKHSVITGAIAKYLAQIVKYQDPELVFSAGLLHDMGKFVLELHAPEAYDRVIFSRSEKGLPLPEEERAYFGFDHAEIGSAFARSWRFPDVFVKVIKGHHDLLTGQAQPNTDGQVLALIQLADYLANTIEPAASDLGFDPLLVDSHRLHAHANLSVADVEKHLGGIKDSIRMSTAFLNFG